MKTWKTWRNVNESYAYTNVARYIELNELMPEDKEKRIKEWIEDVAREQCKEVEDER